MQLGDGIGADWTFGRKLVRVLVREHGDGALRFLGTVGIAPGTGPGRGANQSTTIHTIAWRGSAQNDCKSCLPILSERVGSCFAMRA